MSRLPAAILVLACCLRLCACAGGNPTLSAGVGTHGAGAGFYSDGTANWPFGGLILGSSYSGRPFGGLHFGLPLASSSSGEAWEEGQIPPSAQTRGQAAGQSGASDAGHDDG
ncbi:hypothetical protein LJC15_06150 [Desulfovibrio sp. OttesenSCG-928-G11]|nr:hypothetical protein [Desulfovibrio sp. OttesenSCG-928-G11]